MRRTLILACVTAASVTLVQPAGAQTNFNFSFGSDGVSINVNNYDPYLYMAPPPPPHHHRSGAPGWMYGRPYFKGVSSHDYKSYKKAQKKYRKAQEKYIKKLRKKAYKRRHRHHDDD